MGKKGISKLAMSPVFFGTAAGTLAVILQLLFMPGQNAYGICTICHARDFLAFVASKLHLLDFSGAVTYLSWPVCTTVGLLLGSFCAAISNKEFRIINAGQVKKMFFLGIASAISGLIVMSCPTRLFLRFAYADPFALFAIIGLLAGIFCATIIIKRS